MNLRQFFLRIYDLLPKEVKKVVLKSYHKYRPTPPEPLMYRSVLFEELLRASGSNKFLGKRILEIGPKDGFDSLRLQSLRPKELIMIDLPEKRKGNLKWIKKIICNHRYIEDNFMYLNQDKKRKLGKFSLIYCTGVLYHNPEQMRLLRKLYLMLEIGGYLVLESAILRENSSLKDECLVKIFYPETFRGTGTITHLPTKKAIEAWLSMVGFSKVIESNCYQKYNKNIIGQRYASICIKTDKDGAASYYQMLGLNPKYRFGDSC